MQRFAIWEPVVEVALKIRRVTVEMRKGDSRVYLNLVKPQPSNWDDLVAATWCFGTPTWLTGRRAATTCKSDLIRTASHSPTGIASFCRCCGCLIYPRDSRNPCREWLQAFSGSLIAFGNFAIATCVWSYWYAALSCNSRLSYTSRTCAHNTLIILLDGYAIFFAAFIYLFILFIYSFFSRNFSNNESLVFIIRIKQT